MSYLYRTPAPAAMSSATIARVRALAAELDRISADVQAAFDDASAEAYARPVANDVDHLDALYDAAQAAASTTARLRAAIGA